MKARILSLIGALALCLLAIAEVGTAQAACPSNFCAQAREECLGGCPCADFYCKPASCWSECVCPIFCP